MTEPQTTLDRLAALAEAATPGPWEAHTFGHASVRSAAGAVTRALFAVDVEPDVRETMTDLSWVQVDDGPNIALTGNGPRQTENAAYIAAADPATVAALIAVARAAHNLSDRRTLDSDGFWVSKKEMRALDLSLAALEAPHERPA